MKACIVGGGRLVYFLARSLLSRGHSVTVVNRSAEECRRLARALNVVVVNGEGTRPAVLRDAGVEQAEVLLAVTSHDEDNFVACDLARRAYGVAHTFALLNDPDNEQVFRQLGIQASFAPVRLLSQLIEQRVGREAVINLDSLADGKVNVTEIVLPEESPAHGRRIQDLDLPEGCLIVSILRDGTVIVPRGPTVLARGDRVGIVNLPGAYASVLAVLTGESGI